MKLTFSLALVLTMLLGGCGRPSRQELVGRGLTQYQEGKDAEAKATLLRLQDHYPSDPEGLYYLGRIHHGEGNYGQAIYYYRACLDARPWHPGAREWLRKAEQESGLESGDVRLAP